VNTGTDDHHPDHGNGSGVGATDRDREPAVVAGDPARNAGDLLEAVASVADDPDGNAARLSAAAIRRAFPVRRRPLSYGRRFAGGSDAEYGTDPAGSV